MAMKGFSAFPNAIASPSDCLVLYPGHTLGVESYPSAEAQSVYSTALADEATFFNISLAWSASL